MGAPLEDEIAAVKAAILHDMTRQALLFPRVHAELIRLRQSATSGGEDRDDQMARLGDILRHARSAVPFYRDNAPRRYPDEPALDWLLRFPVIDKSVLRDNYADLCDDDIDPRRCQVGFTSGTTGVPVRVVLDDDHLVHAYATALLRNEERGLGNHRKVLMPFQNWLQDWFEYTAPAHGLARVAEFGIEAAASGGRSLALRLGGFAPDVIFGHPSACSEFATWLVDLDVPQIRPRAVVTFGENLLPEARQRLRETFSAPVYDDYGMREMGTIAAECRAGGHHIECGRMWVEIMDDNGELLPEGEPGEIVITNLVNRSMPLIRYRTGDVGALSATRCSCGSNEKQLQLLEGRRLSLLRLRGGRVVDVAKLARAVRSAPVERFQLVAVAPELVRLLVVPARGWSEHDAARILQDLETILSPDAEAELHVSPDAALLRGSRRKHVDFVDLTGEPLPGETMPVP